jgi:hypothetical protein
MQRKSKNVFSWLSVMNSHKSKTHRNLKCFKLALQFVRSETIADNEEGIKEVKKRRV